MPDSMSAWQVVEPAPMAHRPLRAATLPVPTPAADELLVRVLACGVCRTDLHVAEGDLPVHRGGVVPGHEVVGRVVALGADVTGWALGDRAGIAWLRHTCGHCRYCLAGAENLCLASRYTGWDADGGYARYATVPADYAYRLPDGYSTWNSHRCCAPGSSATGRCSAPNCRPAAGSASTGSAPPRT